MLGYRSYFTVTEVPGNGRLSDVIVQQAYSWLRSKRYAAERVVAGSVVEVAQGVEVTLSLEQPDDHAESLYFALREEAPTGTWVTTIIAHDPGTGRKRPWVWVDIDMPRDHAWTSPPRILRSLLEVLSAHDGGANLSPAPQRVTTDDLPDLLAAIEDPARRGPVFIAGTDASLPMGPWIDYVGELLKQSTGLASGYVLDSDATRAFADSVGPWHEVGPGSLRAFATDTALHDEVDGRRHRRLTTERLVGDTTHRMRRFLGARAREMALSTPVPRAAMRVEERLLRQIDLDLLAGSTTATDLDEALSDVADAPEVRSELDITPARATVPGPITAVDLALLETLGFAVRTLLEVPELTSDSIEQLVERVSAAEKLRRLAERKERDFAEQFARLADLRDKHQETRERLGHMEAEYWDTTVDLRAATKQVERNEKEVHRLRLQLQESGLGAVAWSQPDERDSVDDPETFEELLLRIGEHTHLVWSGKEEVTLELDIHDPAVGWTGKTWGILRALDDYARTSTAGIFSGSLEMYLQSPPPGCATYSVNRYARDESDDVKTSEKFRRPRIQPGPDGGDVFMGAHFKIAQYGTVSPRLHLHDAVAEDGKVYVGYIGPHLPLRTGG